MRSIRTVAHNSRARGWDHRYDTRRASASRNDTQEEGQPATAQRTADYDAGALLARTLDALVDNPDRVVRPAGRAVGEPIREDGPIVIPARPAILGGPDIETYDDWKTRQEGRNEASRRRTAPTATRAEAPAERRPTAPGAPTLWDYRPEPQQRHAKADRESWAYGIPDDQEIVVPDWITELLDGMKGERERQAADNAALAALVDDTNSETSRETRQALTDATSALAEAQQALAMASVAVSDAAAAVLLARENERERHQGLQGASLPRDF